MGQGHTNCGTMGAPVTSFWPRGSIVAALYGDVILAGAGAGSCRDVYHPGVQVDSTTSVEDLRMGAGNRDVGTTSAATVLQGNLEKIQGR
jgi:hypothetical protein